MKLAIFTETRHRVGLNRFNTPRVYTRVFKSSEFKQTDIFQPEIFTKKPYIDSKNFKQLIIEQCQFTNDFVIRLLKDHSKFESVNKLTNKAISQRLNSHIKYLDETEYSYFGVYQQPVYQSKNYPFIYKLALMYQNLINLYNESKIQQITDINNYLNSQKG